MLKQAPKSLKLTSTKCDDGSYKLKSEVSLPRRSEVVARKAGLMREYLPQEPRLRRKFRVAPNDEISHSSDSTMCRAFRMLAADSRRNSYFPLDSTHPKFENLTPTTQKLVVMMNEANLLKANEKVNRIKSRSRFGQSLK